MAHNEQDVLDLMNYTWFQDAELRARICNDFAGKVGEDFALTADLTGSSWSYARVGEGRRAWSNPLENMRRIRELLNED